jgi:hypothetical protein
MGAGAAAAAVWALQEPLDRRVFRYGYSDVAVLGKAVTTRRGWPAVGLGMHAANGALFGLVVHLVVRRRPSLGIRRTALGLALAEHVALFPLSWFVDRYHPRRGQPGVPRLLTARAFGQATWRHTLFGLVLGQLGAARSRDSIGRARCEPGDAAP